MTVEGQGKGQQVEDDEGLCGEAFDHLDETTYEGPDGRQWVCRRCGAEGWEEPDGDE